MIRRRTLGFAALAATSAAALAPVPASGQPASAATTGSPSARAAAAPALPRTPWDDPDLLGTSTTDDAIGVSIERLPQPGTTRFPTDEHEGNYRLPNILSAAREAERVAAGAK